MDNQYFSGMHVLQNAMLCTVDDVKSMFPIRLLTFLQSKNEEINLVNISAVLQGIILKEITIATPVEDKIAAKESLLKEMNKEVLTAEEMEDIKKDYKEAIDKDIQWAQEMKSQIYCSIIRQIDQSLHWANGVF